MSRAHPPHLVFDAKMGIGQGRRLNDLAEWLQSIGMNPIQWWRDLSVAKKLYSIVGAMAILIATELFTLWFAMSTMSAVRSFVFAEGLWSKAQKNAIHSLLRYSLNNDKKDYRDFHDNLKVCFGDHRARLALERLPPDIATARDGFREGGVNESEIDGMIHLLLRFNSNYYIGRAIEVWRAGDVMLDELIQEGQKLHNLLEAKHTQDDVFTALGRIDSLNTRLTVLENEFSETLGAGSRWLEHFLMIVLLLAVITVEGTGIFLTAKFSRGLVDNLNELSMAAHRIGHGDFESRISIRSADELGRLGASINQMTQALQDNIGFRKQAELANEAKSMFLANMSHEIRTPLSAILGFAELLKDPNLSSDERQRYLEVINRTGKNLTHIVNDILDLSKIEAGHLEVEMRTFALPMLLQDLQAVLSFRASGKRLELKMQSEGEVPEAIECDPIRLRQILMNIVGNAIKFTEKGSVTVTTSATANELKFVIEDTGIGLSSPQIKKLFKPFAQVDNSLTRKHEGTGLGLVVSRRLAQALNGDVRLIRSTPGAGSAFEVSVGYKPAFIGKMASATQPVVINLRDKKILLIEDSPDNQMLVQLALAKTGAQIVSANNGDEGSKLALSESFDLVLMDMQMPILDGYSATRLLRARGYSRPIIALTAFAMKDDRDKCLRAGCNDYLSKPLDLKLLLEKIQSYV